jgi:hypothetical protein
MSSDNLYVAFDLSLSVQSRVVESMHELAAHGNPFVLFLLSSMINGQDQKKLLAMCFGRRQDPN